MLLPKINRALPLADTEPIYMTIKSVLFFFYSSTDRTEKQDLMNRYTCTLE